MTVWYSLSLILLVSLPLEHPFTPLLLVEPLAFVHVEDSFAPRFIHVLEVHHELLFSVCPRNARGS